MSVYRRTTKGTFVGSLAVGLSSYYNCHFHAHEHVHIDIAITGSQRGEIKARAVIVNYEYKLHQHLTPIFYRNAY